MTTKIAIKTEVEVLPSAQSTATDALSTFTETPLKRPGDAVSESTDRPVEGPVPAAKRIKLESTQATPQSPIQNPKHVPPPTSAPPQSKVVCSKNCVKAEPPRAHPTKPKIAATDRPPPAKSPTSTDKRTQEISTPGPVTPDGKEKSQAPSPPSSNAGVATGPESKNVPLKSSKMSHLSVKYRQELEYMLREFKKLERQLLGAKARSAQSESTGSRERREKLHSFILHLEDTIRQIEEGCRLEAEGASGDSSTAAAAALVSVEKESAALTNLTKEKEEEEAVRKLEEHILANLLPVKVRLKKQLAAQQGATRNPVGAPTRRGMMPSAPKETGTFAVAAEKRRKAAAAAAADTTQFGKPISSGSGSSLTQKLHGPTLGSKNRPHGDGVGAKQSKPSATAEGATKKILYAGMAPGSQQLQSGVSAASGAHKLLIESPVLLKKVGGQDHPDPPKSIKAAPTPVSVTSARIRQNCLTTKPKVKPHEDPSLPPEERRRLHKLRRKKKKRRAHRRREKERQRQMIYATQAASGAEAMPNIVLSAPKMAMGAILPKKKIVVKHHLGKKGPRSVEYICALCSEAYNSTCEYNPWWALTSHECPKCRKTQIPRIDISSPSNAIEYHPALLANAEDASGSGGANSSGGTSSVGSTIRATPSHVSSTYGMTSGTAVRRQSTYPAFSDSDDSDLSELSDGGSLSDDSLEADTLVGLGPLSPSEEAENENFGKDYSGPTMAEDDAQRLLILMSHASTCPGRHKSVKHRDVCNSAKYLMLHVRDCPGTTASFDICPFPWCRKTKHLLYHLVTCDDPEDCLICTRKGLTANLQRMVGLNDYRRKKHLERVKAAMAAAAKSKAYPPKVSYAGKAPKTTISRTPAVGLRKPAPGPKTYNTAHSRIASAKVGAPRSNVPIPKAAPASIPVIKSTRIVATHPKTPNVVVLKKGGNGAPGAKTAIAVPVGAARKPIVALHPGVSGGGLKPTLHPGAKVIVNPSSVVGKSRQPIPPETHATSSAVKLTTLKTSLAASKLPPNAPNRLQTQNQLRTSAPTVPVGSKGQQTKLSPAPPTLPLTNGDATKTILRPTMVATKSGAAKTSSTGPALAVVSTMVATKSGTAKTSSTGPAPAVVSTMIATKSGTPTTSSTGSAPAVVSFTPKDSVKGIPAVNGGSIAPGGKPKSTTLPGLVPVEAMVSTSVSVTEKGITRQVVKAAGCPATVLGPSVSTDGKVSNIATTATTSSNVVVTKQEPPPAQKSPPSSGKEPLVIASKPRVCVAKPWVDCKPASTANVSSKPPSLSVAPPRTTPVSKSSSSVKPDVCRSGKSDAEIDNTSKKEGIELSSGDIVKTAPVAVVSEVSGVNSVGSKCKSTKIEDSVGTASVTTKKYNGLGASIADSGKIARAGEAIGKIAEACGTTSKSDQGRIGPSRIPLEAPRQATKQVGASAAQAAKEVLEKSIGCESKSTTLKKFPQMPILPSVVKVEEEKKEI